MESVHVISRGELMCRTRSCRRCCSDETTNSLAMKHILTVCTLLWSSGLQAEDNDTPEPGNIRLMGGATRCAGGLEMKLHNDWKPVDDYSFGWSLRTAAVVCGLLNCGSTVSTKIIHSNLGRQVWKINASRVKSASAVSDYISVKPQYSQSSLEITCSESVRLVNGSTLCSGRVDIKANQSWSSVCKGDIDWQDAEVVCRELGCGAPLKLQRVLYENVKVLDKETKDFQCRGSESTLLDCESYESARNTCYPVELTCSEPDNVRLVEGGSRCAGTLEMELQGEWKPVDGTKGDLKSAALVCRQLKCGFAVSAEIKPAAAKYVWGIISSSVKSGSTLREHVSTRPWHSSYSLEISCSDLLFQPMISVSSSINGVYESSDFTISCSIKPQYPGGSFQLVFTTYGTTHNYTQKAVSHTAHFLFRAVNHGHQGNYSCVYHIYVFSHNFSSMSQPLYLTVSASPVVYIPRFTSLLLTLALFLIVIWFHKKTTRGQQPGGLENIELGASRAEGLPTKEARAQGEGV